MKKRKKNSVLLCHFFSFLCCLHCFHIFFVAILFIYVFINKDPFNFEQQQLAEDHIYIFHASSYSFFSHFVWCFFLSLFNTAIFFVTFTTNVRMNVLEKTSKKFPSDIRFFKHSCGEKISKFSPNKLKRYLKFFRGPL